MNRFADYFSNYVNDDTITYIGNGDITSFTVSRQDRELAVGLNLESFIDYGLILIVNLCPHLSKKNQRRCLICV